MILDRRINKEQQEKQLSMNLTRVFVLYITPPKVQNEDPVNIDRKSLEKGSDINFYRGRNKEQKDKRLSTNLTRVFVLYITPRKVQNEDPVNIDRKSIKKAPFITNMFNVSIKMFNNRTVTDLLFAVSIICLNNINNIYWFSSKRN